MLTVYELAKREGRDHSVVRWWINHNGLPTVRAGRRIYIREQDFSSWQEANLKVIATREIVEQPKTTRKIDPKLAAKFPPPPENLQCLN